MLRTNHLIFIITLLLLIPACKNDRNGLPGSGFSSADYEQSIKARLNREDTSFIMKSSRFEFYDTLKYFYTSHNYEPQFIKNPRDTAFLYSILKIFSGAEEHGIEPAVFNYDLIKEEFTKARTDNPGRYKHLANAELLISESILKYAYSIRYGVTDPMKISPGRYFLPVVDSSKRDLLKPLFTDDVLNYLKEIEPRNPQYKKLQTALKHFREMETLDWKRIPVTDKKFKQGDKSPQFDLIAGRLETLGFFQKGNKVFDSFDSTLIEPVKKFQRSNGLLDDGTIGRPTLEKLNTTPEEYIEKIKINLERFRWSTYSDSSRYILVNIPEFYLHVIESGHEKFNIKVCTGRRKPANFAERMKIYEKTHNWRNKPDDWETPQICGQVTHLVLNPTWTVPSSIAKEEIYRETSKDSTYLKRKNFKVFRGGKVIDLSEVNIKKYPPNKIPYTFVQDPGAGNALGKIKFMFRNQFGIYLHDTPTRAPFSYSVRAVSHGCIRVEKPFQLAEYLLKNHSKWNLEYIKIETGFASADNTKIAEFQQKRNELRRGSSYGKTTEVRLEQNIPVFVDYYTAWVNDEGIVNFRNDIYDKDKIVKKYLFENIP